MNACVCACLYVCMAGGKLCCILARTTTQTQNKCFSSLLLLLLCVCVCVWLMFLFSVCLFCAVDSAGAFDDTYAEINSSDEDTGLKADRRASVAWEGRRCVAARRR